MFWWDFRLHWWKSLTAACLKTGFCSASSSPWLIGDVRQMQLPIACSPLFVTPDTDKGETDTCFIFVENWMRIRRKDASGWPGWESLPFVSGGTKFNSQKLFCFPFTMRCVVFSGEGSRTFSRTVFVFQANGTCKAKEKIK